MNTTLRKILFIFGLFLPVLLPFVLGMAIRYTGSAPSDEFLVEQLASSEDKDVKRALSYMRKLEREGHAKYVEKLLHHPNKDFRKDASFVLGRMNNRFSIPHIVDAWNEGRLEQEDALIALEMIPHPSVLPYFFAMKDDPDMVASITNPQQGLNMLNYHHTKIRFYSYDEPVYNRMGQLTYSQASVIDDETGIPYFELEYRP